MANRRILFVLMAALSLSTCFALSVLAEPKSVISKSEAVKIAESFIRDNGYTTVRSSLARLAQESMVRRVSDEDERELRYNTLNPKAYGISGGGEGPRAWAVAFRYSKAANQSLSGASSVPDEFGRLVTMDEFGEGVMVQHKDYRLEGLEPIVLENPLTTTAVGSITVAPIVKPAEGEPSRYEDYTYVGRGIIASREMHSYQPLGVLVLNRYVRTRFPPAPQPAHINAKNTLTRIGVEATIRIEKNTDGKRVVAQPSDLKVGTEIEVRGDGRRYQPSDPKSYDVDLFINSILIIGKHGSDKTVLLEGSCSP